jgi:hypothetical protein
VFAIINNVTSSRIVLTARKNSLNFSFSLATLRCNISILSGLSLEAAKWQHVVMITKQQYVEYLIYTIGNYTSSHLSEHLEDVSHDVVTDYLRSEHLTARGLWDLVERLIQDGPEAFMLVDDSVQDKCYSQFIELVKLQYSGAEHGLVRGIGILNLVHSAGSQKDFYPIDHRIYAPDQDGKTKDEHVSEMVINDVYAKKIKAKRILFDSWYASAENLKLVHRLGLIFFTTLKSNRMVSLSKEGDWNRKMPTLAPHASAGVSQRTFST